MTLDRSLVEKASATAEFEYTAEDVAIFAAVIGDSHPAYADRAATPPTWPIAPQMKSGVVSQLLNSLNLDFRRVLHGEQEFEYYSPLRSAEHLTLRSHVSDVQQRQGKRGPMDIITIETTAERKDGEKVFVSWTRTVYLPEPNKEDK